MDTTRRTFLSTSGAAILAGAMQRAYGDPPPNSTIPDIRSALLAAGFNPDDPEAVLMAVVADVHISLNPATQSRWTDHLNNDLVREFNELQPHLTHLVFDGDVVNSHGAGSGLPRNQAFYEVARDEMRLFKSQLGRFRPDLEVVSVPGNQDTDK
jgi:DNA polymerase II small subunit/DNA polymerase delta subunit B